MFCLVFRVFSISTRVRCQVDGWEKLTDTELGHGSHGVTLTFVTSGPGGACLLFTSPILCNFTEFCEYKCLPPG